jgi:glycosyltransferase involved in cell wall biosynthesis
MKIAINLLPFREKIAGAGKYAQNIIREISRLNSNDVDYYLFVSKKGRINFETDKKNFHYVVAKFNPDFVLERIFWEQLIFPFKLKRLVPDIVFTPSVAIPFLYNGKFYTTIHDLAYKKSKNKYSLLRRSYVRLVTAVAVKKSDIVFTVSDFSKREIEKEFRVKNKKILITYNGVDDIFFNEYSHEQKLLFKEKYSLPANYILYVGAIEPAKNIDKLLIAFAEFLKEHEEELYLVLTSGVGWKKEYIFSLIKSLSIYNRVVLLPYIPENDLPLLYKCSQMLIYLSTYEGFGIPILEAMASEVPVICSQSEAIKEFAGNAVITVDPDDIQNIISFIFKLINDKELRTSKIEIGKKVAENFMWSNSARIINELFLNTPRKSE